MAKSERGGKEAFIIKNILIPLYQCSLQMVKMSGDITQM